MSGVVGRSARAALVPRKGVHGAIAQSSVESHFIGLQDCCQFITNAVKGGGGFGCLGDWATDD